MGGQEGNRGYLIQAIIALLQAVEDDKWTTITLEPDAKAEKVDILFQGSSTKALQVKSSQNQIAKSDAEKWATDLKRNFTADDYELILVGPCAQTVAEMKAYDGVSIPCPKSPDLDGLLAQAAHLLEKFLVRQGLNPQSAVQREIMVRALTTEMSVYSCGGKPLTRQSLIDLLKTWMSSITGSDSSSWEPVRFTHQRNIEHAIAGQRLGPADVEACPELTVCADISSELGRQHIYQIVGTPGCGKSITAWQVAKRFHDAGTTVLRPRALSRENELLANIPDHGPSLLVVDDSHRFSAILAERLSERASRSTRVLLISTVDDPRLAAR